jgi:hypothetical protein
LDIWETKIDEPRNKTCVQKRTNLAWRKKSNLNIEQNCRIWGTNIYRAHGINHDFKWNKTIKKEQIKSECWTKL